MPPMKPYDWPDVRAYPPAVVWLGWDGVYRSIDRAGHVRPPFPGDSK